MQKKHHVIFHSVNSVNVGNQQSVMHDVVHDKKIVCDDVHNQYKLCVMVWAAKESAVHDVVQNKKKDVCDDIYA